ncbi:MAG: hypothetical protein K8T25_13645 [Planctomycetia bacterium]|nr:hypothetical protein [Planctomycetia bacterium]
MNRRCTRVAILILVCVCGSSVALAMPPFKKAFEGKYVTPPTANPALAAPFAAASCNVCHVNGKKKNVRNAYGDDLSKELAKLLGVPVKKFLATPPAAGNPPPMQAVLKQLDTAFTNVEQNKAANGETYGARIKAGKLPCP